MNFYVTPITVLLFVNFLILISLGVYLLFSRANLGASTYSALMFALAIWALFGVAENASLTIDARILFASMSFIGVLATGPLWLLFTLKYIGVKKRVYDAVSLLVWPVYAILLAIVVTNSYHNLFWDGYITIGDDIKQGVLFGHGPIWYINAVLQYAMILGGVATLIWAMLSSRVKEVKFTLLLIVATFIPWVCNMAFMLLGGKNTAGVDLALMSFAISGIIITVSIYRYSYFKIVFSAISAIYHNIGVGIIILDKDKKIIDFNTAAREIVSESINVNVDLNEIEKSTGIKFDDVVLDGKKSTSKKSNSGHWLEFNSDYVKDYNGDLVGYAITVINIDKQILAQEKLDYQLTSLSKINELMVGRELKMIELKKQLSELSQKS